MFWFGKPTQFQKGTNQMDLLLLEKAMKEAFDAMRGEIRSQKSQLVELAQKIANRPGGGGDGSQGTSDLTELLMKSDGVAAFVKGQTPSCTVEIPARMMQKNTIINVAPGVTDPLRQPDRSRGIVTLAEQRMTIRGLFAQIPTQSGSIDVVQESSFTNNAAIQGNDTSPTGSGEGALKAESSISYTAATLNIPQIAHFIRASRQVLSDAPRLEADVSGKLLSGLALKEEAEMLTGDGTGLHMSGINHQATLFTGGATNQTALDTLAKAITQLQLSNFEASGIILHPSDWLAIKLIRDTQGRYLIGDPSAQTMPILWGVPVVPTASQTLGKFTVLDAQQAGYIADRESAIVRISESDGDNFVRNLITILAEERALIVIERPTAIIVGDLSYTG